MQGRDDRGIDGGEPPSGNRRKAYVPGEAECGSMRGNGICECVKVNYHQAVKLPYLMPNSTQARATPHTNDMFLDPGFEFKCFE